MAEPRRDIRFLLGAEERVLTDCDPHMTVLNYLRTKEFLVGTKEGCAEGDCGACTVVIARPDETGLRYEALNSCIQFVPQLDGCQVLAVEHIADSNGSMHAVQKALSASHGSQCGFCTPGFVMSIYALYQQGGCNNRAEVNDALAGNLCRCTGYGPIVDAAMEMGGSSDASEEARRTREKLVQLPQDMLAIEGRQGNFYAPTNLDELASLLTKHPDAVLLAGGTDVGLWVTKQHRRFETVISLMKVRDLHVIEERDDDIVVGAGVTYTRAREVLGRLFPDFGEVIRRIGAEQVRNAGTVGGNIANGSPIGDTPPILIALGATLVLRRGDDRREMPLEDFFIDYGKQDLASGEFVERINIPKLGPHALLKAFKISKRFDQDISAVLGAFHLVPDGEKIISARIAYGGMAATPKRARACEAVLTGAVWSEDVVQEAIKALESDFEPLTDMRATQAYRMRIAQNLLRKVYIESTGAAGDTRLIEAGHG